MGMKPNRIVNTKYEAMGFESSDHQFKMIVPLCKIHPANARGHIFSDAIRGFGNFNIKPLR